MGEYDKGANKGRNRSGLNIEYDQFIGIYDNALPESWCKDVVDFFDAMQKTGIVYHSINEQPDKRSRDDHYLHVPSSLSVETLPSSWPGVYWDSINPCLQDYVAKYSVEGSLSSWTLKIHSVGAGEGYHIFHQEVGKPNNLDRVLVFMTYLNLPDEGGETEFLFQHKRCEPKLGRTLIWPAYFTHLHRGNPVLKGRKVYLTGWYNYT